MIVNNTNDNISMQNADDSNQRLNESGQILQIELVEGFYHSIQSLSVSSYIVT